MDDYSLYQSILNKKPPEKLLDVPEWETQILCKALPAAYRVRLQLEALDQEKQIYDYSTHFYEIVCHGCYNPETGKLIFKPEQESLFMESGDIDGTPIEALALTVLRLSKLIKVKGEAAKNA
jgi:hypothetical protein